MRPANADEKQEWQLLRVLIEYGHLTYDGYESVAKLIEDRVEADLIQQPLVKKLFIEYFDHYRHFGSIPEMHYFINYPDAVIRNQMAGLLHDSREISSGWKKKLNIEPMTQGMVYTVDVNSTLEYFELKKAMKMLEELTQKIPLEQDPIKLTVLLESHTNLKKLIREITSTHQPTVYNSNKVKF